MRLVSTVPSLRRVVEGLLGAVPGIASVLFLLLLVLYIAAVMATSLFRDASPEFFGHFGLSLYSLFQTLTLEGWSDIAKDVMEVYPWAWVFFIGYILIATFLVLNLVVGVVVSSIQARIEVEFAEEAEGDAAVREELRALRLEIASLRDTLEKER
jgi:voltage-gated sodium channel